MKNIRKYKTLEDYLEPGEVIYRRGLEKVCSLVETPRKKFVENIGLHNYPGLIAAWSAEGKTNDDLDRATLKDLTGNGHDITLNGFAWSEMSGYGGYPLSFKDTKYNKWASKYTDNTLSFVKNNQGWRFSINIISGSLPSMKVNIEGIKDEDNIRYYYYDGTGKLSKSINLQNGEILLPESKIGNSEEVSSNTLAGFFGTIVGDNTVTITLLPEYPGALVFDGVDDYGICNNVPQFNKVDGYTIIMKRIWLREQNGKDAYLAAKNDKSYTQAAFCFDGEQIKGKYTNFGDYGNNLGTGYRAPLISWQTSKMMNSKAIGLGNAEDIGNKFHLGRARENYNIFANFAFYSAYLFDRSLGEGEIKRFIQHYIDPEYELPGGDKPKMILDVGKLDKSEL